MKTTTALESRTQAFKRITDGIRNYMNHTVGVMKLIQEAKRLEIWKEKYSSWKEYCEMEFEQGKRRIYQLLEIASTIEEIASVQPLHTSEAENKGILLNLNTRQVDALKGLEPQEKAQVLDAAIKQSGGKSPKPETIAKVRRSAFDPGEQRDYSDAYTSGPSREENLDRDPADKISKSTPGDVAAAVEVSNVYPKSLKFEALNREEEDAFHAWEKEIFSKRPSKNGHANKIDLSAAIRSVASAYKNVTGKTMSVKPMDAGQLRRLLESGITLEEFISVGEKAWVTKDPKKILCGQSHQIAMFVKHYGNIRNEVLNGTHQKDNPRNAGMCAAKTDYAAAVAKARMARQVAQTPNVASSQIARPGN